MAERPKETTPVTVSQTKQPQVEAATNTTMPVDLVPGQDAFELAGFVFGPIVGTEYSDVQIPQGWRRVSVGSFEVDILDDKNRLRAEIRRKTAKLLPRYRITEDTDQPGRISWTVMDGNTVLYSAGCGADDYGGQDELFRITNRWLRIRYDRADNPNEYW